MVTDDATDEEFDPQTTDHYEVNVEYTPAFAANQLYVNKHYRNRKDMNRYLRDIYEVANPKYMVTATIRRKLAPKPAIPESYKPFLNSMYWRRNNFIYWP